MIHQALTCDYSHHPWSLSSTLFTHTHPTALKHELHANTQLAHPVNNPRCVRQTLQPFAICSPTTRLHQRTLWTLQALFAHPANLEPAELRGGFVQTPDCSFFMTQLLTQRAYGTSHRDRFQ